MLQFGQQRLAVFELQTARVQVAGSRGETASRQHFLVDPAKGGQDDVGLLQPRLGVGERGFRPMMQVALPPGRVVAGDQLTSPAQMERLDEALHQLNFHDPLAQIVDEDPRRRGGRGGGGGRHR